MYRKLVVLVSISLISIATSGCGSDGKVTPADDAKESTSLVSESTAQRESGRTDGDETPARDESGSARTFTGLGRNADSDQGSARSGTAAVPKPARKRVAPKSELQRLKERQVKEQNAVIAAATKLNNQVNEVDRLWRVFMSSNSDGSGVAEAQVRLRKHEAAKKEMQRLKEVHDAAAKKLNDTLTAIAALPKETAS